MENILCDRNTEVIGEAIVKWLSIILILVYKMENYSYIYAIIEILLEKYYLFDNDLSKEEEEEELNNELFKYTQKEWKGNIRFDSLSFLSVSFSNDTRMKREGNMIICNENSWESFIFDYKMKEVY